MKNVRTTHFSFVFAKFFSLWREQFLGRAGDAERSERKIHRGKNTKSAFPR
jgi:hypothetical protein